MERWFPVETQRLLLREFTLADEPAMHEYSSDPIVSRYEMWGPNTPDDTHEVLTRWIGMQDQWPRDEVNLAVELTKEKKLIGSVKLWVNDRENLTAGLGYALHRAYWNQGIATEAARTLLDCAFNVLKLHRVWADCDTRNIGSWKVMEKLGMRREGHFMKNKFQKGEWRDSYLYAILSEEWSR